LVDVEAGRELDDVRLQAGRDGARLVAGGAVRLREVDVLAVGRLLPRLDHGAERLARHRVADQAQRRVGGSGGRARRGGERPDGDRGEQRREGAARHPGSSFSR
jgi:hypothetical protein